MLLCGGARLAGSQAQRLATCWRVLFFSSSHTRGVCIKLGMLLLLWNNRLTPEQGRRVSVEASNRSVRHANTHQAMTDSDLSE